MFTQGAAKNCEDILRPVLPEIVGRAPLRHSPGPRAEPSRPYRTQLCCRNVSGRASESTATPGINAPGPLRFAWVGHCAPVTHALLRSDRVLRARHAHLASLGTPNPDLNPGQNPNPNPNACTTDGLKYQPKLAQKYGLVHHKLDHSSGKYALFGPCGAVKCHTHTHTHTHTHKRW